MCVANDAFLRRELKCFIIKKILLALLELYGGKLSNTELEKSLFLFCQNMQYLEVTSNGKIKRNS